MKPITTLAAIIVTLVSPGAAQNSCTTPTPTPTPICGEWFWPFPQCADNCWWTVAAMFGCRAGDYQCFCPKSREIFEVVEERNCLAPDCQWGANGRGSAEDWETRLREYLFCQCEAQRWTTTSSRRATRA